MPLHFSHIHSPDAEVLDDKGAVLPDVDAADRSPGAVKELVDMTETNFLRAVCKEKPQTR